jgi:CubicO group peptidase (beta-lactamase class C family)
MEHGDGMAALAGGAKSALSDAASDLQKEPSERAMSTRGFSKTRLSRMHDVMAGYVERGEVPGIVTLVSRRGETHVDAIGAKALGGENMGRDTIFRIASLSKPVAAAAAMILVEQCKLRLDEPVDRLLPELSDRRVLKRLDGPLDDTIPARRPITLRDLLTFRLGCGIVMAPPDTFPIQKAMSELRLGQGPPSPLVPPAPDEWIRRFSTLPLMHQPGEKWMYHTGSDVLGVLIARASGKPLETFLREGLFEPLGMKDTAFSVPAAKLERFATSYWTNFATGALELYDEPAGQWSRSPAFLSAGGGLVSTIDDYFAFGRMMLNKGKHESRRVLSRSSVETMTTDQLTPEQKAVSGLVPGYFDSHGWGFGLSVVTRRDDMTATVGKFGWDGGLGTSWYSDPQEDMVGILMTQRSWTSPHPPDVCLDFWTSAYQSIDD